MTRLEALEVINRAHTARSLRVLEYLNPTLNQYSFITL